MTLVETLVAMLLLGVFVGAVLFGSTYLLVWIQNRLVQMPNYVLAMGRLYNAVYLNIRDIQRSATFTIESPTTVRYCLWDGDSCEVKSVDLEQLVQSQSLGGTLTPSLETATVTVKKPAENRYMLLVYLSVGDQTGRKFDNTVLIKKLVNAAPIPDTPDKWTFDGNTAVIPLMFPALGFGQTATYIRTSPITGVAFIPDTTVTTAVTYTPTTAVYSLDGSTTVMGAQVYTRLIVHLQIAGTSPEEAYVQIPEMVGVDDTPVPNSYVKVVASP